MDAADYSVGDYGSIDRSWSNELRRTLTQGASAKTDAPYFIGNTLKKAYKAKK